MKWLKKLWNKNKKLTEYQESYEKDDIIRIFEDLEVSFIKKQKIVTYSEQLEEKEKLISEYECLEQDKKEKLQSYIAKYKNLEEKQKYLKGRLIKNNRGLLKISEYEREIPTLIKELKMIENKVKDSERDLFYLQEEQEALRADREDLVKGYGYLKIISGIFLLVMAVAILGIFGIMQWLREDIWLVLAGLGCIVVVGLVGLLYAKERIEQSLHHNELLQHKAAKFINKCKVRYFHNNRYLEFEFEKLGVDSVAKLEMLYNRYMKNRNNEKEYNEYTRQLMFIEEEIQCLFAEKDLHIDTFDIVEEWLSHPKKIDNGHVEEERKRLKDQMKGLEQYEEELIREIFVLAKDQRYQTIIDKKMQEYMALTKTPLTKKPNMPKM